MALRRTSPFLPVALLGLWMGSFSAGCGPAVPEYTLVRSHGGGTIKLEHKSRLTLPDDSEALLLRYRTDLSIDDAEDLRAEVEEVLRTFRTEADREGIEAALIEARALRGDRWSRIGRAQRFAFRKRAGGQWELVERQPARTTAVKPL